MLRGDGPQTGYQAQTWRSTPSGGLELLVYDESRRANIWVPAYWDAVRDILVPYDVKYRAPVDYPNFLMYDLHGNPIFKFAGDGSGIDLTGTLNLGLGPG